MQKLQRIIFEVTGPDNFQDKIEVIVSQNDDGEGVGEAQSNYLWENILFSEISREDFTHYGKTLAETIYTPKQKRISVLGKNKFFYKSIFLSLITGIVIGCFIEKIIEKFI
jgi:hypothetical protein